jgi:5-(carboxyamino)imidazole ribonucleotide synthase
MIRPSFVGQEERMQNLARIGILGGGQLSLMLADAAVRIGLKPVVFAQSADEPAFRAHPNGVLGSITDEAALSHFFSKIDIVVFENEFVDCEKLARAAQKHDVIFSPQLSTIALLQDKLQQKQVFGQLGIPSPEHFKLELGEQTEHSLRTAIDRFGHCVLKWSRMGYDGKGVMLLDPQEDQLIQAAEFCARAETLGSAVYAEEFVPFKRELAIVGVYSKTGEFLSYPVVVSEQENSMCARVFGPATQLGLSQDQEAAAKRYAEKLAKSVQLYGSFALEMFETKDGRIVANEVAPRVHNSGHYTQDACVTDQFENHWRAALERPLGPTDTTIGFAMFNFLGPDDEALCHASGAAGIVPEGGPHSRVHWYVKAALRPRRKMGHINGAIDDIAALPELIRELEESKLRWVSALSRHSALDAESKVETTKYSPSS